MTTFFCDDDYLTYRDLIAIYSSRVDTEVWAYCLMPNHIHLVLVPSDEDGLRSSVAEVHRRYSLKINERQGWRGHLWQERFYSVALDEHHLFNAVRYIERNPVVAGLVDKPEDWPWSSARAHLAGENDLLVKVQPMLDRIDNYREYVSQSGDAEMIEKLELHLRTGRSFVNR